MTNRVVAESPIVDDRKATFIWRGDDPPHVIGDFEQWGQHPLSFSKKSANQWHASIALEPDAYIEYAFVRDGKRIFDPQNPRCRDNGLGLLNNLFGMPDWRASKLVRSSRHVPAGELSKIEIVEPLRLLGGKRECRLYRPPGAGAKALLVVLDGQDYLHRARLPVIIDNLLAAGRVRPIALALLRNAGSSPKRMIEYSLNWATLDVIVNQVIPQSREWSGVGHDAEVGVLGASMGGLMALMAGLGRPDIFKVAISQSGALTERHGGGVLAKLAQTTASKPRIWMDVGRYEYLLAGNRILSAMLGDSGYDITYREYPGGHNWTCWRAELEHALTTMFPA